MLPAGADSASGPAASGPAAQPRSFPAVVAGELRSSLLDYLRTTFKLQNTALEQALFTFLEDPERGLFRGPYLDVRLPFVQAPLDWREHVPLDYVPGFRPYAHQLQAFERLGARGQAPRPTLITTGTGSGKTECFLYPLLDHCRRARQQGQRGIKAIVLYPMNALASDQAARFAQELAAPELAGVSAGLYVGGKGRQSVASPEALIDDREVLRKSPPDILLTNYKMLDLLLMRPADASLWRGGEQLRYLVLDELHSYDGAQGSDVACLIRRLKARLGTGRGQLCPVGTSATLGSGTEDPRPLLLHFASQVFGEDFELDAIIEETRCERSQVLGGERASGADRSERSEQAERPRDDTSLLFERLAELARTHQPNPTDPGLYATPQSYLDAQAALWGGLAVRRPIVLGHDLREHHFLSSLLRALTAKDRRRGPVPWADVLRGLSEEYPELAALPVDWRWSALASFLSLISQARRVDEGGAEPSSRAPREQPFLHVEVQLWVRELRGLLCQVTPDAPRFTWADELPKDEAGEHWLPLLYCRECGCDGLAATQRVSEARLRASSGDVGRAFFEHDSSARVVVRRPEGESEAPLDAVPGARASAGPAAQRLCAECLRLFSGKACSCGAPAERALTVQVYASAPQWPLLRCPDCHARNGLTWLASRVSTLCSVALSRWYASEFNPEPKLLAFTDSVQDASHRAGFFGGRAHRFSLRTALQSAIEQQSPLPATELARALRAFWQEQLGSAGAVAALLPPDLREDPDVVGYLQQTKRGKVPEPTWRAIEERLGFDALFEFSLGVNQGRSLEATGCSTLSVVPERLARAAAAFAEVLREEALVPTAAKGPAAELERLAWRYLEGLTQRLRRQCGVLHPWLLKYARSANAFLLSRRSNPRISHFSLGNPLPVFWHLSAQHDTHDALFASTATWYQDFFQRLFRVPKNTATGVLLARKAVRCLSDAGILAPVPQAESVLGLTLESLAFTRDCVELSCAVCRRQRAVPVPLAGWVLGTPCDRFRCAGVYAAGTAPLVPDYYKSLYRSGRLARIYAEEHTGLLDRHKREDLEKRFKQSRRADAPNLLSCTPTLEMGIDIGDLDNVMLCSVPPRPTNYLQRIGRAGRKSGNALVVTWANRRPHDLYFFAQPEEMLRGQVAPPGCFLDAPEMLARQMLAHALDQWATVAAADALPHEMRLLKLDKPGSFPQDFVDFYGREQQRLTDEFLELFALEMSPDNAKRLRASSGTLLKRALEALAAAKDDAKHYAHELERLDQQLARLDAAPDQATVTLSDGESLGDGIARERRELLEMKGAYGRLRMAANQRYPLNVLTDAGVLPNYAFPEPGVTLSALMRDAQGAASLPPESGAGPDEPGSSAKADAKGRFKAKSKARGSRVEYLRPASQALRDFAPFNTFYAEGHKIRVSQLDLGTRGDALEAWVLCPRCHHAARALGDGASALACPQCGDPGWADGGQRFTLLHFRRALSVVNRSEAATRDDSEEREQGQYRTEQFIDVGAEHWQGAWLVQSDALVFGYELLRDLELRELNFGPRSDTGIQRQVGGLQMRQQGFLTCRHCGKVSQQESPFEHAPTCGVRTQNWSPKLGRVLLYRSLRSEAIRVLLPVSDYEVERIAHSLRAALQLGFRRKFKGQPLHLQITLADEYRSGKKRRFLIIYDTVPGGTGYLAELWKTDGFLEVLALALRALQTCSYCLRHGRDGCYRCLFAYQEQRFLPHLSRQTAIALLDKVVAAQGALQKVETLSHASLDQVLESELEQRFVEALASIGAQPGWQWQTVPRGGKPCYALEGPAASWLIEPQRELGTRDGVAVACRPDFIATCSSDPNVLPIAIFCDGLEFHVCPEAAVSRLGDDLYKRQAILDSGQFHVWSLTWKDLDASLGTKASGITTLFAELDVRQSEEMLSAAGIEAPLALRNQDNFGLLRAFLQKPDAAAWRTLCLALGAGSLKLHPRPYSQASIERKRQRLRSREALSDRPLSSAPAPEAFLAGYEKRAHAALLSEIPTHALAGELSESTTFGWTLRLFDTPDDRRVHTLRAGDDYRIIVVSPPEGSVYLIMWVDHHDEAMSWARNKVFEVNKYTGTFQVWEGTTETKGPETKHRANDSGPANDVAKRSSARGKRLLSDHSDDALLLLGVPEPLLPAVRGLHTESDLDALARFLPREASDALYCLVSGYTPEQTIDELERRSQAPRPGEENVIDTSDLAAALARDETKAQFKILGDDHELTEILNAPLSQWRIFLHPSQARLAALKASGPVRVLGGAGTGKTVVAMHRARHLAREVFTRADERILFTTFTKNLALDIRAQLRDLCGPEVERIDVLHLHGWASQFLESRGVKVRLVSADSARRYWEQAFAETAPEDLFDLDFYQDEWRAVVQAQGLLSEADYLKARRSGRGTRLNRPQREKIWRVLANYRSRLDRSGALEADDLIREARLLLEQNDSVPLYSAVVADEVQDFSEGDLLLLRCLAVEAPNDLFLVGDGHQRIYGRVASLSRAGINVRGGRTRRLKLNYRTTQHIKSWATALLAGMAIDDLDEGEDSLKGYYSLRRGSEPQLRHWKSEREEADFIVQQVRSWLADSETQPGDGSTSICLVARHKHQIENRYKPLLEQAGIPARIITKEERPGDGVRLATMHRVKGLEFPRVLIAGVQDGEVPHARKHFADETARQQHEDSERRLLFVAATRARDALTVTGFGPKCRWL